MSRLKSTRLAILLFLTAGGNALCAAQAYTPPPPPLTTLPPCPVPKDAKDAKKIAKRKDCDPTNRPTPQAATPPANPTAQKFPYPGEESAKPADTSAAKSFPYPGESPSPAPPATPPAKQFPYPGENPGGTAGQPWAQKPGDGAGTKPEDDPYRANPNVPHDPAAEKKATETTAGKSFPYPGDSAPAPDPNAARPAAAGGDAPGAESSSSSSSSSAPSSSSDNSSAANTSSSKNPLSDDDDDGQPQLADKGSEGKRSKKTIKPQTDSERVDEDLSVAKFYSQSGNSMGAYLRAKDAVKTEPDLPEARFAMGEAARRLKKVDEAKAEFGEYLKLAPDGEHARDAEKALAELR